MAQVAITVNGSEAKNVYPTFILGSAAAAQTKTIKLTNGGAITGTVEKIEGGYKITTKAGITTSVRNDQVKSIEDASMPEDEYLAKLKKIIDEYV